MKNLKYIFLLTFFGLFSCEDVIDVDLPIAEPRLVVEASLNWFKENDGSYQMIRLTTTTGFYEEEVPIVSGAIIWVENEDGLVFDFVEEENGYYYCYDFIPEINKEYTLNLIVNGEHYTATEILKAVPEIQYVEQRIVEGFGDDTIELKYFFQDNPDEDNYYMSQLYSFNPYTYSYGVFNDEFFQGSVMYGLFFLDNIHSGNQININLYGISARYYNYMVKLDETANNGGGPFQTAPANLRGNLINQTNPDNYALGYFRLSEVESIQYMVE